MTSQGEGERACGGERLPKGVKELDGEKDKRAKSGPKLVGTVANGVAESEKLPQSKDGDDSSGDGDNGCGGKKNDADDNRDENQSCGDAFPSHEEEGYQKSEIRNQESDIRTHYEGDPRTAMGESGRKTEVNAEPQSTRRNAEKCKRGESWERLWRSIVRVHPYKPTVGHPSKLRANPRVDSWGGIAGESNRKTNPSRHSG